MGTFTLQRVLQTVLVLSLCFTSPAYTQTSAASLTGNIRDATGALLPGVTLTITDSARNTSLSALTNDAGSYVIPVLNPGAYSITAELPGFKRFFQEGIVLQVAQVARLDITLEVGQLTQSVDVSATTPLIETETS